MNKETEIVPSSFRDPSGFLFRRDGLLYRQVNNTYKEEYDKLIGSGLYEVLTKEGLLISHEEVSIESPDPANAYKIIQPQQIPFISYPYEWCFSQLKEAALTTLKIQKKAFDFGMSLKDASAYNIQFRGSDPVHIDTLSFGGYREGEPWVAYRQFCQHFLAPLAIMSYTHVKLNQLLRIHVDGVPLDLASSLLPFRSRFRFAILTHIHLHARTQKRFEGESQGTGRFTGADKKMGRKSFLGLIDSLESGIKSLSWKPKETVWTSYYGGSSNYSSESLEHKKELIEKFLDEINPEEVWDLGANVGLFSRICSNKGIRTVSFDLDPACVEGSYLQCRENGEKHLLPLLLDLTNPSPGIGWENKERTSLLDRGPTDTALALALVHHLAISNNTPFPKIANLLTEICKWLIIEFIPKSDPQAQKLLAGREDIFSDYTQDRFENSFEKQFSIMDSSQVRDSQRIIYLMKKKQ
ncbi:MAG: SAM-dependent methyltransferase [Chloroflexota bacterium]